MQTFNRYPSWDGQLCFDEEFWLFQVRLRVCQGCEVCIMGVIQAVFHKKTHHSCAVQEHVVSDCPLYYRMEA